MTPEPPTMKTPRTNAIIASDTGDSRFIAELVQQCRSFEDENKELREVCDKQAQMLACQAKRNSDLFQELQTKTNKHMTEKARITLPVSVGDLAIILEAMSTAWGEDIFASQEGDYIAILKPCSPT